MAKRTANLVVWVDYQFIWMWNSKQTLGGVNTDVNQGHKYQENWNSLFVLMSSESEMHQEMKPL